MSRLGTVRNILIVLAIAAIVAFLPGAGRAAATFRALVWAVFAIGIAYVGARLYREHRVSIYSLGSRHRGLLYGSLAVGALLLAGRARMWETGAGEFLWFVLLGAILYALFAVYRFWRSY